MASIGYVRTLLAGLPEVPKRIMTQVMEHLMGNLRFGPVDHHKRAENFQAYFVSSTTASDTSEFSVVHGLATTPRFVMPVLDPSLAGATLPVLTISKAADARRLYFKAAAGSTNVAFSVLVE